MKVLIVGSGGREHAIAMAVAKSPRVDKIYCAPGNAGIAAQAECVPIGAMEFDKLIAFAKEKAIDFTIIGMDDPLVGGLVDVSEPIDLLASQVRGGGHQILVFLGAGQGVGHGCGLGVQQLAFQIDLNIPAAEAVFILLCGFHWQFLSWGGAAHRPTPYQRITVFRSSPGRTRSVPWHPGRRN